MSDTTTLVVGRTILATICFAGAVTAIVCDKDKNWGWLILAGLLVAPGSMSETSSGSTSD